MEGHVKKVLEQNQKVLVGILHNKPYWHIIPDNPRIRHRVKVRDFKKSLAIKNHKVVVHLDPWKSTSAPLTGIVMEDLGPVDGPGIDMLSILRNYQLEEDFSQAVEDEAHTFSADSIHAEIPHRKDLRDILTFTIDPEEAKDHDDAVSLTQTPDGHWNLGVHIADVPHFVPIGSDIDKEAYHRSTNAYLIDRVIPMLPRHLTTDLCSLKPLEDRLTHSLSITLDKKGAILHTETFLSVIRSSARLTYTHVQSFLEGQTDQTIPKPIQKSLMQQQELAALLRKNRLESGSLEFNLPEIKCILDTSGKVTKTHKRISSEAYQLIEEFMLIANQAVAHLLFSKSVPALYRIHKEPDLENWLQMMLDLKAIGIFESPKDQRHLNDIVQRVVGTPREYPVSLAILRNLTRAVYSSSLGEHFGLAFSHYTHFTSPIRRYPDLVIHRILRSFEESTPPPYTHQDLTCMATHCSERERHAEEAEKESVALKLIDYYDHKLRKGDTGPFPGIITSIASKGLLVELEETLQRGLLPFSLFTDDYYVAEPERGRAIGKRRKKVWSVGDLVSVELVKVCTQKRLIDFRIFNESKPKKERKRRRCHHKKSSI
ncbi:MAG: VacB/RNase II family 3'-5' exoribonuclease [Kiritimatiellae bacterium]|nr:VacB/RNase II family 3'-5' exoribonuclease [Kiritimatiellia bacterium]